MRQRLWLGPAIVFVTAIVVYGSTAPSGLTWAHNSADGGDLVAAALVGGVPHPSGYPTFVLLARLLSLLPWHTPAWRVTLISIVSGAAAAALTSASVQRLISRGDHQVEPFPSPTGSEDREDTIQKGAENTQPFIVSSWLVTAPGIIAGLTLAFAPMFWGQATVAEVYALHACLAAFLIWSMVRWRTSGQVTWCAAAGLAFGLALGNHLTSVWLAPFVGVCLITPSASVVARGRALGSFLLASAIGLLVYTYLPAAAMTNPPVNWGDPRSLAGFGWVVFGEVYRPFVFAIGGAEALGRVAAWSNMLWRQFLPWGFLLALAGLMRLVRIDRAMAWGMLASLMLGLIWAIGYNTTDSALTLLPGWVMFGLWIGLGMAGLIRWFWRFDSRAGVAAALVGLILLAVPLAMNWSSQDLKNDTSAEDYLTGVLEIVEPDALVVTVGDKATFALWYARYGLNERTDIIPISRDLWSLESYRRTVASTHSLLPGQQPLPDLETLVLTALKQQRPVYVTQADHASGPSAPLSELPGVMSRRMPLVASSSTAQEPEWVVWKLERSP